MASTTTPRSIALPQTIGWYGITLRAPEEWAIGAIGGSRESGYLRIDEHLTPRLEIKWQRAGAQTNVQSILDNYLKGLMRQLRKRRIAFESNTNVRILRHRKKKKSPLIEFIWKGDRQGCGLIWKCTVCSRVVIAQVSGPRTENLVPIAQRVFESLEDHGEAGWETWNVYGFQFEIPDKFNLEKHRLMTGQLQLDFMHRKVERILLLRWARAATLLKPMLKDAPSDDALRRWLQPALKTCFPNVRFESGADEVHNHEAIQFIGRTGPITHRLKEKTLHLLARRPTPRIAAYGWRCEEEDKIIAVACQTLPAHEFLGREVAESVVCHE